MTSKTRKILIVDDETEAAQMLASFLDFKGFETVLAVNGLEAVARCEQEAFDLVLTDMRMPGMDGRALITHLQEICPDVPIVVMSGHDGLFGPGGASLPGVGAALMKPLDVREVASTINLLLAT